MTDSASPGSVEEHVKRRVYDSRWGEAEVRDAKVLAEQQMMNAGRHVDEAIDAFREAFRYWELVEHFAVDRAVREARAGLPNPPASASPPSATDGAPCGPG